MRAALLMMTIVLASATTPTAAQRDQARERAQPHYRQGLQLLRMESWDEAVKAFDRAIEADPGFEMAYYGLGRARMPQRQYAQAVRAFEKARDLFQAEGGRQFTNQQEAQRYRRERITEIDDVIRQYQQGPQTGQVQEAIRQLQQQKRDVQERIQRGMNVGVEATVPAYLSLALGSAYFRLGKLADAEREYKAAVERDPKIGEAHNNLAVVYLETGRIADAERAAAAAERAGFKVNPQLMDDIKTRAQRRQ